MKKRTAFTMFAAIVVLSCVFYFGGQYFGAPADIADPVDLAQDEQPNDAPESKAELKIEGTPITTEPQKPEVTVKEDPNGNQEITPVIPKEPEPTKEPETEILPEVVKPEPEVKPEVKPVVKPQPKPTPKPETKPVKPAEPAKPKDGDMRTVNGQKQVYFDDEGWVEYSPGGESEYVEGMGTGEVIGY